MRILLEPATQVQRVLAGAEILAVVPGMQRCGIGRRCLDEVMQIAAEWPGDAIRLDAFDAEAGVGEFYHKCGFNEVGRASYRNTPLIYFEMVVAPAQPKGERT